MLFALLALLGAPGLASAAFPGKNGRFVLSLGCAPSHSYLATLPSTGGELREIGPCARDIVDPEVSPDGRTIIAVQLESDPGLITMAPDGDNIQHVPLPGRPYVEGSVGSNPSFAPDGERFTYDSSYAIWTARRDGSDQETFWPADRCDLRPELSNYRAQYHPRWSPDGKYIAIAYSPACPGDLGSVTEIWLLRASDGSFVRKLAKRGSEFDWSPDGRHLVYRTPYHRDEQRVTRGGNLYVVSVNGGRARKLVHREGVAETHPTWSPDGRWIAFISRLGEGDEYFPVRPVLWRVKASGGKPRRIQRLPEPDMEEGYYRGPELAWLPRAN